MLLKRSACVPKRPGGSEWKSESAAAPKRREHVYKVRGASAPKPMLRDAAPKMPRFV
jgi:hypothetical protein